MSKIAIVVASAPDPVRTIAALRQILPSTSAADLKLRIARGAPIIEAVLFENNYREVADRLRSVVDELPKVGASLRLFELAPDEDFDPTADLSQWEISTETLLNILSSAPSYG
jgi:hypothetical protein